MSRYLLSVFGPVERGEFGDYSSKEDMLQAFTDTGAFNDMLEREGHFVFADGLASATTATTVDGQGDNPVYTDGPYLDTRKAWWVLGHRGGRSGRGDHSGYRNEWARVIAGLARRFGDLDVAEEAAAEAFAVAVERWPKGGIPPNPGGWLTTTATRKAIDRLRLESRRANKHQAAEISPTTRLASPPAASRTTASGWSSPAATLLARWRPGWRSRCACWAG